MKRRIASGEFGNPKRPDMQAVNDAWSDILETKLKEVGKDGNFNAISGLWPRKGDKVAFDGRTQEEISNWLFFDDKQKKMVLMNLKRRNKISSTSNNMLNKT